VARRADEGEEAFVIYFDSSSPSPEIASDFDLSPMGRGKYIAADMALLQRKVDVTRGG